MIEKIGKYKIVRLIGEGAMGEVYEAIDEAIERRVAIKILHSHILQQKNGNEFLQRFHREAKLAAQCMHPNIVAVLEYGQHEQVPFLAMEYVEGTPLDKILKKNKPISMKTIILIMSQILKALHAAHNRGIIHRDIKPANIIVIGNGEVKLADFGVARMPADSELTQTGSVIGTPRFMSPEQMLGMELDHRADLFAATMVFMDLLGLLSVRNNISFDYLPKIFGLPPNNFINYKQKYPVDLLPILQKGLAADIAERFSSAKEYAAAIKNVLPQLKSGSVAPAPNKQSDADDSTQCGVSGFQLQAADLQSMQNLLSSYIGPIASKLVQTQRQQATGKKDFAMRLAEEIPTMVERHEFLERWDTYLKTTLNSQLDIAEPSLPSADGTIIAESRSLSTGVHIGPQQRKEMQDDYASYVGPMAEYLIQFHMDKCNSMSEFVYILAEDIPTDKERNQFIQRWVS